MNKKVFGWFEGHEETPSYDPGMEGLCPVCARQLDKPIKTISLMPEERNGKSYFFRSHKECWENLSDHEQWLIESSLIDEVCESDK